MRKAAGILLIIFGVAAMSLFIADVSGLIRSSYEQIVGTMATIILIILTIIIPIAVWLSVKPVYELRRHISDIVASLDFYARDYCNNKTVDRSKLAKAESVIRNKGYELTPRANEVKWYGFWARIGVVPKKMNIAEASEEIKILVNSVHNGEVIENGKRQKRIKELLGVVRGYSNGAEGG